MGGTVPVNISRYWQSTCTQLERHFFFGPYKILALGHMPSNPRTCSSSSGVKSFLILNVLRISSGVLPAIHKSILRKLDSVISSCPYSIFLHLAEGRREQRRKGEGREGFHLLTPSRGKEGTKEKGRGKGKGKRKGVLACLWSYLLLSCRSHPTNPWCPSSWQPIE